MTPGVLLATIRQVPGVSTVRRWIKGLEDRVYITFSVLSDLSSVWYDLHTGAHGLRYRETEAPGREQARRVKDLALETIGELVAQYRRERVAELSKEARA